MYWTLGQNSVNVIKLSEWIIFTWRHELIFNMCSTNLKTVHTFRSFLYGAILDRPKNTALGGGGGKNTKQQAPQGKLIIQWLYSACLSQWEISKVNKNQKTRQILYCVGYVLLNLHERLFLFTIIMIMRERESIIGW